MQVFATAHIPEATLKLLCHPWPSMSKQLLGVTHLIKHKDRYYLYGDK